MVSSVKNTLVPFNPMFIRNRTVHIQFFPAPEKSLNLFSKVKPDVDVTINIFSQAVMSHVTVVITQTREQSIAQFFFCLNL